MWLFTTRGFFSVVEDVDPAFVQIRARAEGDLKRLKPLLPKSAKIVRWPGRDYPARIVVSREAWEKALARLGQEVTYRNFKDEVTKRQGRHRHDVYLRVWGTLLALERATSTATGSWGAKKRRREDPVPLFDDATIPGDLYLGCRECGRQFAAAESREAPEWCPGCGSENCRAIDYGEVWR